MVSGFYGAPKGRMPRTWRESDEEESHSGGSVSGRRRKKESGGVQDARTEGFKTRQQQKTHCTLVYTQPHPSPRPGPAHSSSPHTPTPTPNPPATYFHFVPHWNKLHTLSFKVGEKRSQKAPALYSSCWINCVNNGQLGANLESLQNYTLMNVMC